MENRFVIDPEECIKLNPTNTDFVYKQAQLYCRDCQSYQHLTTMNSRYATPTFDFKRSTYYGSCLTTKCQAEITEAAREKLKEDIWFAKESYLRARCDRADAKCDLFNIENGIRFGTIEDATKKLTETERREDETFSAWKVMKQEYNRKYSV